MPYHAEWYLPYQVIHIRISGRASPNDLNLSIETSERMLAEAQTQAQDNVVHLLLDTLEAESIPPIYLTIPQGHRVLEFRNRGTMFLIAQDAAIRSIMEVTAHITREHFPLRVFTERQAALDALASHLATDALRQRGTRSRPPAKGGSNRSMNDV